MKQINTDKLILDIEAFARNEIVQSPVLNTSASNKLTRMFSRLNAPMFGNKDVRKHKYRMSLLSGFTGLESIMEDFEASILGSSGESIFVSIQHLANASRQVGKLSGILSAVVSELKGASAPDTVNEDEMDIQFENDEFVFELIKDFAINKMNFNFSESSYFQPVDKLIIEYEFGDQSLRGDLIKNYKSLIKDLSGGSKARSLEDVLRINQDKLEKDESEKPEVLTSEASLANFFKKWYGKANHNLSIFDETSPIRLDLAKEAKGALSQINTTMSYLEKDLDPYELFDQISTLNKTLAEIRSQLKPLIDTIQGSSFGDKFLELIKSNKLTDYPSNLSNDDQKSFESYLRTKEFKGLLDMYSGKESIAPKENLNEIAEKLKHKADQ